MPQDAALLRVLNRSANATRIDARHRDVRTDAINDQCPEGTANDGGLNFPGCPPAQDS